MAGIVWHFMHTTVSCGPSSEAEEMGDAGGVFGMGRGWEEGMTFNLLPRYEGTTVCRSILERTQGREGGGMELRYRERERGKVTSTLRRRGKGGGDRQYQ